MLRYLVLVLIVLSVSPSYADLGCGTPRSKVFACPKDSQHTGEFYCSWIAPCSRDGVNSYYEERRCLVASANSACPSYDACVPMPDCNSPKPSARHSERDSGERQVQQCRAKTPASSVCVLPPSGLRTWN